MSLGPGMSLAAARQLGVRLSDDGVAWAVRLGVVCYCGVVLALLAIGSPYAVIAIAAPIGALVGLWGLSRPEGVASLMLLTLFLRKALPQLFGMDPFLPAFAGVLAALAIHVWHNQGRLPRLGTTEVLIAAYIAWNLFSWLQPHYYNTLPGPPDTRPVWRFVATGTIIPLTMYVVGRVVFRTERTARLLLWTVIGYGAYSAFVSICQFHAPSLVWPRYIVTDPVWVGRANGVPDQPVMNGLLLVSGYVAAILVCASRETGRIQRAACLVVIIATSYGVYLTHTRAAWLAYLIVTVAGALLLRRARPYFLTVLVITAVLVIGEWSTFTSSNRDAGGVGSVNEVDDRLNLMATQIWAFKREPWFGYGIGTFPTLNTYHHQQLSLSVPWVRGYGIASHENELGILVELGLLGLTLWVGVLVLIWRNLVRAVRSLDPDALLGRPYAFLASLMLLAQILGGLTVDLRFFDFNNALVFLVVGSAVGLGESVRGPTSRPAASRRVGRTDVSGEPAPRQT